jgi:hypothetical protein
LAISISLSILKMINGLRKNSKMYKLLLLASLAPSTYAMAQNVPIDPSRNMVIEKSAQMPSQARGSQIPSQKVISPVGNDIGRMPASQAVGAIQVTPQMMNGLEGASQKITQKEQELDQRYTKKIDEVKAGLETNGYEVTTIESRSESFTLHAGDFYVTGPRGGLVEVSTTTINNGKAGTEAVKNIEVYEPGESSSKAVVVYIDHPDAKAAIFHKSDVVPSAEVAEDALDISMSRGNAFITSPTYLYNSTDSQ